MKALIVDDSLYMRATIRTVLKKMGIEVVGEAKDGKTAVSLAMETKPDLITLDNVLPDLMGVDILRKLMEENHKAKILMVSAVGNNEMRKKAISLGAKGYIVKPFEPKVIMTAVKEIMNSDPIVVNGH